jgi:hypothetical protein
MKEPCYLCARSPRLAKGRSLDSLDPSRRRAVRPVCSPSTGPKPSHPDYAQPSAAGAP